MIQCKSETTIGGNFFESAENTNSPVILIADDDRDILSIIETILQEDGYQTLTASDGEQAVMLVQTHAVQLLILDIMMPKMNGLQAANANSQADKCTDFNAVCKR